jgi:hypothetical protein
MPAPPIVSGQHSADIADLPRPDAPTTPASDTPDALPRPVPLVSDTGRIKFGAACRIPLQK